MRRSFTSVVLGLALIAAMTITVSAQDGLRTGLGAQAPIGTQNNFNLIYDQTNQGDYVAAGIGLRNLGSGTINLPVPAGASISQAFMFWAVIWDGTPPANTADLNGTTYNGIYLGTSGSPCWGGTGINFYYADVTADVVSGANSVANVPSGLTNGAPPQGNVTYPLAEGASIVAVFCHPAWDYNRVAIFAGNKSFTGFTNTEAFGAYTATTSGNPADITAMESFIMADGQAGAGNGDGTAFNAILTSGPGTAVKTTDAFDGADGHANVDPVVGLWDTHNLDISSFFPNQTPTAASVSASAQADCITWGGYAISVKASLHAAVDVKAQSCPNSVNINSGGVLPVSIVGAPGFDVTQVDPTTVTLNGVSPFGSTVLEDSTYPYVASACGVTLDCYDCNTGGADGFMDLVLKFKKQDVVATLGNVQDGDCIEVTLSGEFYDGTEFEGRDVLRIIDNGHGHPKAISAGAYSFALEQNAPNPVTASTTFQYSLPTEANVRLEVYNTLGQLVASVVDGFQSEGSHSVTWNGLSSNGTALVPGTYVYRLTAGEQSLAKTLIITR